MERSDVVVIGGGISGLLCAIWSAQRGRKVRVLSYGQGALTVAGGVIDLYGYEPDGSEVENPLAAIAKLKAPHPYALVGVDTVKAAVESFIALTTEAGYPYVGDGERNLQIPTAIGTFKPSGMAPQCLDGKVFDEAEHIIVMGFKLLKDFFPELIANGCRTYFAGSKSVGERMVELSFEQGRGYRDVSALDVARELSKPGMIDKVVAQLKGSLEPNTVLIFPPVLGERADYRYWQELQDKLGCKVVETSSMPPSVTGLRLDRLLRDYARQLQVDIIDKAHVTGAQVEDGTCLYVTTQNYGRVLHYAADNFVLATGGVFGGGLIAKMGRMIEPIFNLELDVPEDQSNWSYQHLFAGKAQPFASYGVAVNEKLQPLTKEGAVAVSNVRVVGRSLAGYDFCFEKSGNGVAVATAYAASQQV
ncbi:MAG: anaerobic glycerol-3-phosphate dehydrogenase subunit B [Candidatus Anaerobiospirillum merdipullorum]|uniref:Anaerobic glycerol-3-phosphate dehydrogenase subunit B n=1 Tax=Candidatus Anaerobiospirillum merdipullorum TaxID=2838450 RepID=A0A9E2KN57_9GAMM|nr:anaerobic glycerol-3-phosphate dehydrogenase subunit B [Candidatus Anaerobiospirillum merdipullorum]